MEILEQNIPLTHSVLSESLKEYTRLNDKISYLMKKGELYSLAKGKYVTKQAIKNNLFLKYQAANILYGPSYISRYSALSFYGLLSESTTIVESMTMKRSKIIDNNLGSFHFFSQPTQAVFPVGVESKKMSDDCSMLIANPAKAICDIIWTTPNLFLSSMDDLIYFLEDDIRIEINLLKNTDLSQMEVCVQFGKKKKDIQLLLTLIKNLQ